MKSVLSLALVTIMLLAMSGCSGCNAISAWLGNDTSAPDSSVSEPTTDLTTSTPPTTTTTKPVDPDSLHAVFDDLCSFTGFMFPGEYPDGYDATVVYTDCMKNAEGTEDGLAFEREKGDDFGWAKKADFEAYVNAHYDVDAETWDALRQLKQNDITFNVSNVPDYDGTLYDPQTGRYLVLFIGGAGGRCEIDYAGYVKEGSKYYVYLTHYMWVAEEDVSEVEGAFWRDYEYVVPDKYLRHEVSYEDGVLKKYRSEFVDTLPKDVVKPE